MPEICCKLRATNPVRSCHVDCCGGSYYVMYGQCGPNATLHSSVACRWCATRRQRHHPEVLTTGSSSVNQKRVPALELSTCSSLPIALTSLWQIARPSPALE